MKTLRLHVIAAALGACLAVLPARAQWAVTCVNCGMEVTQLLNNVELMTQTVSAANRLTTQISQLATMYQNLTQLPTQLQSTVSLPFQSQVTELTALYNAVNSLANSANQVQSMMNGTLQSAASMNMTPSQYNQYLAQQAQNQGGIYQQMLTDNNRRLQELQSTSTAFRQAADNIPNIQGNLDNLQQLNLLAAASGNVATEMLATNRQALAMSLRQNVVDVNEANRLMQLRQQSTDDLNVNLDTLGSGLRTRTTWR